MVKHLFAASLVALTCIGARHAPAPTPTATPEPSATIHVTNLCGDTADTSLQLAPGNGSSVTMDSIRSVAYDASGLAGSVNVHTTAKFEREGGGNIAYSVTCMSLAGRQANSLPIINEADSSGTVVAASGAITSIIIGSTTRIAFTVN